MRYLHTGELGGFAGQILAFAACLGVCLLVWTGLSLSLRRLINWSRRRGSDASIADENLSRKVESEVNLDPLLD
jgi:uncharacterized iron-regulated membrane protein